MKNNEEESVILSAEQFTKHRDVLIEDELLCLAIDRMKRYDPATLISEEDMDRELGITQEEFDSIGEVEFE